MKRIFFGLALYFAFASCRTRPGHENAPSNPNKGDQRRFMCPYPASITKPANLSKSTIMNVEGAMFLAKSTNGFDHHVKVGKALAATGLYKDFGSKAIADGIIPFEPQYPLWTDGAEKIRWIKIPSGQKIDTSNPDRWVFPVGTKLWKQFTQPNSDKGTLVETRFMEKRKACSDDEQDVAAIDEEAVSSCWHFAVYWWNDSQTDALEITSEEWNNIDEPKSIDAGTKTFASQEKLTHKIPPKAACISCHSKGGEPVLGFDYLQLSNQVDPHTKETVKEKAASGKRLSDLSDFFTKGLDENISFATGTEEKDSARTAFGYLHGNCGHCHNKVGGYAMWSWGIDDMPLRFQSTDKDGKAYFQGLVDRDLVSSFDGKDGVSYTKRVAAGKTGESGLLYRLQTRDPEEGLQMPLWGSEVPDPWAVDKVKNWIRTSKK